MKCSSNCLRLKTPTQGITWTWTAALRRGTNRSLTLLGLVWIAIACHMLSNLSGEPSKFSFCAHTRTVLEIPTTETLTFHGIASSADDAARLIGALAELSPGEKECLLRVHFTAPLKSITNVLEAKSRMQCHVSAVPLRSGGTWADIPLGSGTDVFLRPGVIISKEMLIWVFEAHKTVGKYMRSGGERVYVGADVGCEDMATVDSAWSSNPSILPVYSTCLFSPFRNDSEDPWQGFVDFFRMRRGEWNIWPHISAEFPETPRFWKGRGKHRDVVSRIGGLVGSNYADRQEIWELWFARWAEKYSMRVVKRRGRSKPTVPIDLGPVWSAPNEASDIGGQTYLSALQKVVLKGVSSVSITVVDTAFLELTQNWICNVQTAGYLPENIVWMTLDTTVREALDAADVGTTVDFSAAFTEPGAKRTTKILYGRPAYWKLMLLRTRLIRDLLLRGIDVFLFETDQTWLQDPLQFIEREITAGADIVGTLDTQYNVQGNTLILRSVLPTRRLWDEVYLRFKASCGSKHVATSPESKVFFVEHDQYTLSDLLLYNQNFMRDYPVALGLMNADLFVGGTWYSGGYSSEASKRPVLINNNFITGTTKKKRRAQKFGHWFLDKDGRCNASRVHRALNLDDDRKR